jgi:ATP synthase protein I
MGAYKNVALPPPDLLYSRGFVKPNGLRMHDANAKVLAKIKQFLGWQSLLALLLAAGFAALVDKKAAYSVLLGAMVYLLPTWAFARRLFRHFGAQQASNIVRAFYAGEAMKLLLSALLFAGIFAFLPVAAGPLFVGFIALQCSFCFAPWILK